MSCLSSDIFLNRFMLFTSYENKSAIFFAHFLIFLYIHNCFSYFPSRTPSPLWCKISDTNKLDHPKCSKIKKTILQSFFNAGVYKIAYYPVCWGRLSNWEGTIKVVFGRIKRWKKGNKTHCLLSLYIKVLWGRISSGEEGTRHWK